MRKYAFILWIGISVHAFAASGNEPALPSMEEIRASTQYETSEEKEILRHAALKLRQGLGHSPIIATETDVVTRVLQANLVKRIVLVEGYGQEEFRGPHVAKEHLENVILENLRDKVPTAYIVSGAGWGISGILGEIENELRRDDKKSSRLRVESRFYVVRVVTPQQINRHSWAIRGERDPRDLFPSKSAIYFVTKNPEISAISPKTLTELSPESKLWFESANAIERSSESIQGLRLERLTYQGGKEIVADIFRAYAEARLHTSLPIEFKLFEGEPLKPKNMADRGPVFLAASNVTDLLTTTRYFLNYEGVQLSPIRLDYYQRGFFNRLERALGGPIGVPANRYASSNVFVEAANRVRDNGSNRFDAAALEVPKLAAEIFEQVASTMPDKAKDLIFNAIETGSKADRTEIRAQERIAKSAIPVLRRLSEARQATDRIRKSQAAVFADAETGREKLREAIQKSR